MTMTLSDYPRVGGGRAARSRLGAVAVFGAVVLVAGGTDMAASPFGAMPPRAQVSEDGLTSPAVVRASVPEAETLVGLDQSETAELLGVPAAMEEQSPAKVWRYVRGGCALRVFFYMDMTSQVFRALSYDVTSDQNASDDDQQCFANLVDRSGSGHGGRDD